MRRLIAVLVALSLVIPVVDAAAAKQTPEEKAAAKAEKAQQKAQNRVRSIEGQIVKEEARHARRIQKLEAVQAKLEGRGNLEAAARIEAAVQKENQRHERTMARLQQALEDAEAELDP
ncbi:MAG: hypothetical protein ABIF82_01545 [Planctomycetota bacterium]